MNNFFAKSHSLPEGSETSVPHRFEKIVRQDPGRLALKDNERSLTYGELQRFANQIAHAIAASRPGNGQIIALLFELGVDAIAAVLAILKSGNVYVALDPSVPVERLKTILGDSQARLIVSAGRHQGIVDQLIGRDCPLINVDFVDDYSDADIAATSAPNDLAVLTYTSGSTGTPKGVAHTHANLLSKWNAYTRHKRISPDDRVSLLHSLSFAASHGNFLISLLNGAALLPFDIKAAGVPLLAAWLEAERISIAHLPVMVFRDLARGLTSQTTLRNLRVIYLSGAPITEEDFILYKEKFTDTARLEIGMGSTETGHVCLAMLDKGFEFPNRGTPVGYPLPGKRILLLDDAGQEVGRDEIGEIAVRSADLSAGYWRQPQLTAEKFLPVPGSPDERTYLSGDLGLLLPDGFLIHLGRKDLMAKIRGYRVEAGEVESHLRQHPQIAGAAVVFQARPDGEKFLVGHVAVSNGSFVSVSELKNFLRARLPDYMIPQFFRFWRELPLTNGKLDRRALSTSDPQRPSLAEPYLAARNEVEFRLAAIWSEVLDMETVGVRDNFFNLGGHSVAASRLLSRIIHEFQLKQFPLQVLLERPTIEEMAAMIERQQALREG
jgi:amino acid adenylation domain-containing protein